VVTIENPIEFLHRDLSCSITQREVGVDTDSLAVGLRAALRQDPDVVILGDMGDAPTIDTALKAAETGRLVIGTIATPDVVATVERVIGTLPPAERDVGRMRFEELIEAGLITAEIQKAALATAGNVFPAPKRPKRAASS
jgi:twitching motility protein PilT